MTTATLPDSGRHIVETLHSSYVIDMDARTFERWPAAPEASTLHGDGAATPFLALHCQVGESMRIDWRVPGERAWHRVTTPVMSITAAP